MSTTKNKNVDISKANKTEKKDAKNKANVTKVITEQKDLMYQYPSDATDIPSRKKFRSGIRRKTASLIKQIAKAETKKAGRVIREEAITWAGTVYTADHIPSF